MVLEGGKKVAPPFRAIAQMNTPNMVMVTPSWETTTNGESLEGCTNIIDVKMMI